MQYIFIRELKVQTVIGVHADERQVPQTLTFDLEVGIRDKRAFASDDLTETIDYALVVALIKRELQAPQFLLLERLAQHLCDQIEQAFAASWIRLSIAKGDILAGARQVGVVLEHGAAFSTTDFKGTAHT
jgi:7,8-dihydroneopterin aldolase/epimerase/oxygenase